MIRLTVLTALIALSGCGAVTKDLSAAGKGPGIWVCAGKGTLSVVGQLGMFGSGSGAITYDCGAGAYFGQGYPASNLPTMPAATTPVIKEFPPLGAPPPAVAN